MRARQINGQTVGRGGYQKQSVFPEEIDQLDLNDNFEPPRDPFITSSKDPNLTNRLGANETLGLGIGA